MRAGRVAVGSDRRAVRTPPTHAALVLRSKLSSVQKTDVLCTGSWHECASSVPPAEYQKPPRFGVALALVSGMTKVVSTGPAKVSGCVVPR